MGWAAIAQIAGSAVAGLTIGGVGMERFDRTSDAAELAQMRIEERSAIRQECEEWQRWFVEKCEDRVAEMLLEWEECEDLRNEQ